MAAYEVRTGQDLGAAIGELRKLRGLNQEQAARIGGLSKSYVSKIESGRTVSLLEHQLRLLRRMGARVVVELPEAGGVEGVDRDHDRGT